MCSLQIPVSSLTSRVGNNECRKKKIHCVKDIIKFNVSTSTNKLQWYNRLCDFPPRCVGFKETTRVRVPRHTSTEDDIEATIEIRLLKNPPNGGWILSDQGAPSLAELFCHLGSLDHGKFFFGHFCPRLDLECFAQHFVLSV